MADKKISELDAVLQINNDAVFPMSQDNSGEPTTFKASITQLGAEISEDMTFSNLQTQSKKIVGAINELQAGQSGGYTEVSGTLTAGATSITLSDASITTTSTIDIYTDVFGIQPTNAVVATGSITLTFLAQASDITVKVRVS